MQLIALVLRTNLVKTAATARQFIKHGFVHVNFEKVVKPYVKIAEGDVITLSVTATQHAFFEQLQGYKKQFWLDKEQQNIVYQENLSHTTKRYKSPTFYNNYHIRNTMKNAIRQTSYTSK
jgi:ribosomal protein S4